MKLFEQPAHVLHDMLVNKEITSLELTQAVLARIDEVEGDVQAYLTVTRDEALAQAKAVDEKIARGEEIAFLEGIPGAARRTAVILHELLDRCEAKDKIKATDKLENF
ncbi:MAG: amidase family protein, partial [Selenomonadaceae bacterium]|nr:amidase family protein [Selenomonadaceae bacterium]